ncbi:MAG TPA: hypothetical protein VGC06_09440 [Actinomycetes bacterium]
MPPRDLGGVISAAFAIYRRNAGPLLLVVAVVVVPLSLLSFLITYVAFAPAKKTVVTAPTTSSLVVQPRSGIAALFAGGIAIAIGAITSAILQAAVIRAAAQATIGDPVDLQASYRWALRRFGSVLLVAIMVTVLVTIGFALLVIPGIVLLVLLAVSIPAVVVEGARGTEALARSWNLVKGHFWHVFGVGLVALLIVGVVTGILSSLGDSHLAARLVLQIVGQILVGPFSALVTVLLYFDLRARVERLTPDRLRAELAARA